VGTWNWGADRRARRAAGLRAGFFLAVGIWPGPLRREARDPCLEIVAAQDCLNGG
jgi:hypothetical protein